MRILCDLDCTVADFFKSLFKSFKQRSGKDLTPDDVKEWDLRKLDPMMEELFKEPGFFSYLEPIGGAIPGLKVLQGHGHEIYVATSPCTPLSATEKMEWCGRYLPFIDRKKIIIAHDKHLIRADMLIDDSPTQAEAFKAMNPGAQVVSIAYQYNKTEAFNGRYGNWSAPEEAWIQIVHHVLSMSDSGSAKETRSMAELLEEFKRTHPKPDPDPCKWPGKNTPPLVKF